MEKRLRVGYDSGGWVLMASWTDRTTNTRILEMRNTQSELIVHVRGLSS